MIRKLTFLFISVFLFSNADEFNDLNIGHQYYNFSTKGNLIPTLYRVLLDKENPPPAIRVTVSSEKASTKNQLTVTVIHGKTIHNIALPRIQSQKGKRFEYWTASDTLCDYDSSIEELGQPVQLSISSSVPALFDLRVECVDNFHIGEFSFDSQASPPEPRFYKYTFPDNVVKVDVRITSSSKICARIFTRTVDCPVFDASGLMERSGLYFSQSFTIFGGFSLRKIDIGPQFHLAYTVNTDDSTCQTGPGSATTTNRSKNASILVIPVTDETLLSVFPMFVYTFCVGTVLLITYLQYRWLDRYENNEPNIYEGHEPNSITVIDRVWLFNQPTMIVSHKEYEKQRIVKDSKYFNFLFFQIFGSVLPALTTLFQNEQKTSNAWDMDKCYLDYLCALDSSHLNSTNAMASASSLAVIGTLNLIIIFRKKIFNYQIPRFPTAHGIQQRDAPKVVCLLGMIAMGVLWTITSDCPQKITLHIYTYTCLWVYYSGVMWIYSKRHGVKKWHQFFIIAVSSVYGCITLMENSFVMDSVLKVKINISFSLTAISSTAYLCYNYIYERPSSLHDYQWIPTPLTVSSERVLGEVSDVYRPLNSKIVFIILSMGYSIYCSIEMFFIQTEPVYRSCIALGKGQFAIYLLYYIIQKVRFEKYCFSISYSFTLAFLTTLAFLMEVANQFLLHSLKTYSVLVTPAESREFNVGCVLPGIGWNDIRHYNCAFGYFLFILLIDFIDSNIKNVPKENIFVF